MSGALSKRQQARNERAIQDLIKSVPGNNVCADCQARNPGWASWSLGIFLCMRCAALHRKMGTHISKVKSLSMDSWSNEQVENMKRIGNVASNRIYNPNNTRPPIPFDADEADSAMERFIRGKYQDRVVKGPARNNTGSTNSDDHPPPLPPKTGSRFGFRSASSIFPLSSKSKRQAAARSDFDDESRRNRSPSPPRNKPSRVFGASVDGGDDLESKIVKLRDMGFRDEKRNIAVLKGLGGNLEKSIETLVRLGEGNGSTISLKLGDGSGPSSRSRTPLSPTGLSMSRSQNPSSPTSPLSTNPFDMLDAPPPIAQPQSSQSTGSIQGQMMGNNPYQQQAANSNPFGLAPSQSQYNLNQAFQNMSVSPTQPLFPNHTGGFPVPQQTQQQQLYQQSMTPPVPSVPQKYYPTVIYENSGQQVQAQPQPQQINNYNPFLQSQQQVQQQQQPQQVPAINTNFPTNPYMQQVATPQSMYQSPMEQSAVQQQGAFYDGNSQQQQPQRQMNPFLNQSSPQQMNPFFAQSNQQQQQMPQQAAQQIPQMQQQVQQQQMAQQVNQQAYDFQSQQQARFEQYRQQTHPMMSQPGAIPDKKSILDLYNYPSQYTPVQSGQQQQMAQGQLLSPVSGGAAAQQQQQPMTSSPLSAGGSKNPFALSGGGAVQSPGVDTVGNMVQFAPSQNGARHVSQESISVDTGGWANGRHSPDAWGSISARSVR